MKTKHEKIVEVLKELIPPPSNWLGHPEDRIPTWESRLSRATAAAAAYAASSSAVSLKECANIVRKHYSKPPKL